MSIASTCPKHMEFGPCGGVRSDGRCEVDDRRCAFLDVPLRRWGAPPTPARAASTPRIICDIRAPEPTLHSVRSTGDLHRWADAVLVGDHHETVDLPAAVVAAELQGQGIPTWVTLSCRDRNRVALESDLISLREAGAPVAHCVTGDARAPHVRPGSTPVFDLDSHRLVALARSLGLDASVAETPSAPPTAVRPERAVQKHLAGASWCFVNLCASAAVIRAFAEQVHVLAPELRLIVCIGVFTDADGYRRLGALPGVRLGTDDAHAVLDAVDPVEAGIAHAVAAAREVLALPGVVGVNLSGVASTRGPHDRAAVLRDVADRLR